MGEERVENKEERIEQNADSFEKQSVYNMKSSIPDPITKKPERVWSLEELFEIAGMPETNK